MAIKTSRFYCALLASLASNSLGYSIIPQNNCGDGEIILIGDGFPKQTLNAPYQGSGDFHAWRVYLQTGSCAENGDGCSVIEGTFDSGGAWIDNSLIPPLAFSVPFSFSFQSGVAGRQCLSSSCSCGFDTYCVWDDDGAVVNDPGADSVVTVSFCPGGSSAAPALASDGDAGAQPVVGSTPPAQQPSPLQPSPLQPSPLQPSPLEAISTAQVNIPVNTWEQNDGDSWRGGTGNRWNNFHANVTDNPSSAGDGTLPASESFVTQKKCGLMRRPRKRLL